MTRKQSRVERLVRISAFREDLAESSVREALAQQQQAMDQQRDAVERVEAIGVWKEADPSHQRVDLDRYLAALQLEADAMVHVETAVAERTSADTDVLDRKSALSTAALARRAAAQRNGHIQTAAALVQEKKQFDQASDVWLNNREVIQ